jgi:hypothetical protein
MPPKRNSPPLVMTWGKAAPVLAISGLFDVLRYSFLLFWLIGPAMIGLYCAAKVGDVAVIGGLLTKGCVAGAALIGIGGSTALIAFGSVMAIAVGFAGWLTVVVIILMTNSRALGENPVAALWLFEGIGASVTVMAWGVYKKQIEQDKAAFKKYQKEQADTINLMQASAAQQAQDEIY